MNNSMGPRGRGLLGGLARALAVALIWSGGVVSVAAQTAHPPDRPKWQEKNFGYDDGFFMQTDNGRFRLKTNGLFQVRFQVDLPEEGQSESRFSVPRGRVKLSGHAFSRKYRFGLLTDFGQGEVKLLDAYLDIIFLRRVLHLWVGQGKKPFDRQFLTSGGHLEFGQRGITVQSFGAGRDMGVMFHNNYKQAEGLGWAIGVYNGTGVDAEYSPVFDDAGAVSGLSVTNVPDDYRPELVMRLAYNAGGDDTYSEGDLTGGPFRWSVGASGRIRFDAPNDGFSDSAIEVDAALKGRGWSFVTGNYVLWQSPLGSDGLSQQQYSSWGTYNQLSYTLAKKHSLPLRYALVDPGGPDNKQQELLIGYTLYVIDHQLQWHVNGGAIFWDEDPNGDTNVVNSVIRTQLQFAF